MTKPRLPFSGLGGRIATAYVILIMASMTAIGVYALFDEASGRFFLALALAAVVTASLATVIAMRIARYATRPIAEVTGSARKIAGGHLDQKVAVDSYHEISELGEAFNRMAESLRRSVADLAGEKDKLDAILSSMSEGVIMTSREGVIALANPAAEKLLGVSMPSGKRLIERIRDHELHALRQESLQLGKSLWGEIEIGRGQRYLSVAATPMPDLENVLMVLHDITDLRRMDKTRREFVANVSHELRTPLTSIKAAVDTLQEGAIEDRQAAVIFLQRVSSEVDRMDRMISDLLELSRLESGQMRAVLADVAVAPLVQEATESWLSVAAAKGVNIEVKISPGLLPILADAEMVRQVLSNLLDNAIKFTPEGGRVMVVARQEGNHAAVTVTDNGPGIPAEHLPHIFERFYKVDKSRTGKGTGLGLAIAKHIAHAHGGEIRAESEEGRGSSFTFTVPLASGT